MKAYVIIDSENNIRMKIATEDISDVTNNLKYSETYQEVELFININDYKVSNGKVVRKSESELKKQMEEMYGLS